VLAVAVLATDRPDEKVVEIKDDIEEKERKLKDKDRLEKALKLRETEEAAENTGAASIDTAVWLMKDNFQLDN